MSRENAILTLCHLMGWGVYWDGPDAILTGPPEQIRVPEPKANLRGHMRLVAALADCVPGGDTIRVELWKTDKGVSFGDRSLSWALDLSWAAVKAAILDVRSHKEKP